MKFTLDQESQHKLCVEHKHYLTSVQLRAILEDVKNYKSPDPTYSDDECVAWAMFTEAVQFGINEHARVSSQEKDERSVEYRRMPAPSIEDLIRIFF